MSHNSHFGDKAPTLVRLMKHISSKSTETSTKNPSKFPVLCSLKLITSIDTAVNTSAPTQSTLAAHLLIYCQQRDCEKTAGLLQNYGLLGLWPLGQKLAERWKTFTECALAPWTRLTSHFELTGDRDLMDTSSRQLMLVVEILLLAHSRRVAAFTCMLDPISATSASYFWSSLWSAGKIRQFDQPMNQTERWEFIKSVETPSNPPESRARLYERPRG